MQELEIHPDKLKAYKEKDLDYKDQARKIICTRLGYEPPLNVSILAELNLRHGLKLHERGETSKNSLDDLVDLQIRFINRLMLERVQSFNC